MTERLARLCRELEQELASALPGRLATALAATGEEHHRAWQLLEQWLALYQCLREVMALEPCVEPHQERIESGKETPRFGIFERFLVNGTLHLDDGEDLFVPEVVLTAAGLEHGDRVKATPTGERLPDGSPRYFFQVVESHRQGHEAHRQELVGALRVEENGRDYVFYLEHEDGRVYVNEGDARRHGLQLGSVVTLAFNPAYLAAVGRTFGRVVRCHRDAPFSTPFAGGETRQQAGNTKTAAEPESGVEREAKAGTAQAGEPAGEGAAGGDAEPLSPIFEESPLILVVGGRNRIYYEEALRSLGADFEWMDGTKPTPRLDAAVARADAVVLVPQFMAHAVSQDYVMPAIKRYGKPFMVSRSENPSGMIAQLREELAPRLLG